MDEIQAEEPRESVEADPRSQMESESPSVGVLELLGDFTRTQNLLKSLRLTLNQQIVVQVDDVAGGVSEAGRKLKMGEVEQANHEVGRLYSTFHQRTTQWESQARNLEQQLKTKAAKNPKSVSIDTMSRMRSEQTAVRGRIRSAEVQFRRLHQGLDQAFTDYQRQSAAASGTPAPLPAGFLASFKAAMGAERAEIVKQWFDIESVLKAHVRQGADGGYKIKFDPQPQTGDLYFLAATAQVIRLQQLGKIVLLEELETGHDSQMPLKDLVKHVQSGVWLLKPASDRPGAGPPVLN